MYTYDVLSETTACSRPRSARLAVFGGGVARHESRRPARLKVVAAGDAVDVQELSGEEEAREGAQEGCPEEAQGAPGAQAARKPRGGGAPER